MDRSLITTGTVMSVNGQYQVTNVHPGAPAVEILRMADGKSCFMQGEKARAFLHEVVECKNDADKEIGLCRQYDEVMKEQEPVLLAPKHPKPAYQMLATQGVDADLVLAVKILEEIAFCSANGFFNQFWNMVQDKEIRNLIERLRTKEMK